MKKIIKANFNQPIPAKMTPPKIPDLVLNFASDASVFTLWVPADEMGNLAKMFCKLMDESKIVYKLEEKPR